jgi:hypothetical protein
MLATIHREEESRMNRRTLQPVPHWSASLAVFAGIAALFTLPEYASTVSRFGATTAIVLISTVVLIFWTSMFRSGESDFPVESKVSVPAYVQWAEGLQTGLGYSLCGLVFAAVIYATKYDTRISWIPVSTQVLAGVVILGAPLGLIGIGCRKSRQPAMPVLLPIFVQMIATGMLPFAYLKLSE